MAWPASHWGIFLLCMRINLNEICRERLGVFYNVSAENVQSNIKCEASKYQADQALM